MEGSNKKCYCKREIEIYFNSEKTESFKFKCGKMYEYFIEDENSIWIIFNSEYIFYKGCRFSIKNNISIYKNNGISYFSDYFVTQKEYRKLKLEKINGR